MPRAPGGPRVRYIALRVRGGPKLDRRGIIQAIRDTGLRMHGEGFEDDSGVWLTRFKGPFAIVRCHHTHQDTVRQVLEEVESDPTGGPLRLEPIATSGTIRTLVDRHVPQLKEPPNHLRRKEKNRDSAPPRERRNDGRRPVRKRRQG